MYTDIRAMIVEDDNFQQMTFLSALENAGIRDCSTAYDGAHALQQVAKVAPDIIFCDLKMPGMDGIEFIRQLGEIGASSNLVIVSGLNGDFQTSVEKIATSYGLKVLGKIVKPVTFESILTIIKDYDRYGTRPPLVSNRQFSLSDIKKAIDNGEIKPHFQPKISACSGAWTSVEALARWYSPTHGHVSPYSFISVLENLGETSLLFEPIFEQSLRQSAMWSECGKTVGLSINLSIQDLIDVGLSDRIFRSLKKYGVPSELITIEVTESSVTAQQSKVIENLVRLRMNGINLSIDDFGTGYSTMQQLCEVPFNELKIDTSFVKHCDTDNKHKTIVEAAIKLAQNLGMHTVAEGIETRKQWEIIKALGADEGQGYLFSKAIEGEKCMPWDESRLHDFDLC